MATNRRGKIYVIDDDMTIEGEDSEGKLVDFTIEDNCYVDDTFIGTTVAKKITVNILNPDNEIDLENKEIQAFAGVNDEWIPFGNFIVEKPDNKEVKQKTSFTGYDYMIKFNVLYKDRVIYPIKVKDLLKDLCQQVGLEVGNTEFTNSDYMILGNPFTNGENCRTVLSNIAQLAGGFAKIGRDNKVYIRTLKNTENLLTVKYVDAMTVKELNLTMVKALSGEADNADESLDGNNYNEDFSRNEQWGGLNSLILGLSGVEGENTALEDKADIKENGLTEITIQDNYFLTDQAEREKVIVPIWNDLKGLKYLPFKTEYYGYPYLDCGDMIYLYDTKDVGYISYVFNHTFTFNGAFSGSIETPALTKTQTAYKNTFDLKTKFRRAERSINKIDGKIEDILEEQDEQNYKLSVVEQDIDGIKQRVSNTLDFTTEIEDIDQLLVEDALDVNIMKFTAYAENTDALYFSENVKAGSSLHSKFAGQEITLVIDTEWRTKPTPNARKFNYVIEPMHKYNDICDQFIIERNNDKCIVKILRYVDKNGDVYTTFNTPKEEILEKNIDIELFKGKNYVYLEEYQNWNMNLVYINGTNINDYYASKVEMKTEIEQTDEYIRQTATKTMEDVEKKLEDYPTNEDLDYYASKIEMQSEIEQSAEKITSQVTETVAGQIDKAKQEAIDSANETTDDKLKDYSTTTQMNSIIDQKASGITTSVTKTVTENVQSNINKAKQDAINSSNSTTDTKLEDYTKTTKLGTWVEQNWEYIKIAWNQISQYLKLEGADGKASLNIYNSSNKKLMTLDQDGEVFYDGNGNELGKIGVIRESNNQNLNSTILAFSMPVTFTSTGVNQSAKMAWGVTDAKTGTFYPVFYMSGVYGAESSEYGGMLEVIGKILFDIVGIERGLYLDNAGDISWFSDINNVSNRIGSISAHVDNSGNSNGIEIRAKDTEIVEVRTDATIIRNTLNMDNHNIVNCSNWASDERLKKNIKSSEINATDKIMKIQHRQFDWKKDDKHEDIGYIAQELEKIDKNYAQHNIIKDESGNIESDMYEVRLLPLISTATKAIQEQQEQINKQNKLIQELTKRIEVLEGGKE